MRYLCTTVISLLTVFNSFSQLFESGFAQITITDNLFIPTSMAFAPDGRIFITEKFGNVRVVKDGELLEEPFVSLSVTTDGDRGLLSVVIDPDFENNNYIYFYYTMADASANKIVRFTANGDRAEDNSDVDILELSQLGQGAWHNGGAMRFDHEGKLYVATGEASLPESAQDLDSYHGKLLRLNADGSIPEGNPYTEGSEVKKRVWALGLRNPYTFDINRNNGTIYINDVGEKLWEEINDATIANKNFGWPEAEGPSELFDSPFYAFAHTEEKTDSTGSAITGGTFYLPENSNYPEKYVGLYFFLNFGNPAWINTIVPGDSGSRETFATNLNAAVSLTTGNDGNLYYLSTASNSLYKIIYYAEPEPIILEQPRDIITFLDEEVSFSASVAGENPITYEWYKDGVLLEGPAFESNIVDLGKVKYYRSGEYYVKAINDYGSAVSDPFLLDVLPPNDKPVAQIDEVSQENYGGGEIISFSGSATDTEDGILSETALSWRVDFHHADHVHPYVAYFENTSLMTFETPVIGETSTDVFFRIHLISIDNTNQIGSTYVDILPRISTVTLDSEPSGLSLFLDGKQIMTPYLLEAVVGMSREMVANDQDEYFFYEWRKNDEIMSLNQSAALIIPEEDERIVAVFGIEPLVSGQKKGDLEGVDVYFDNTYQRLNLKWNRNSINATILDINGRKIRNLFFNMNTTIDLQNLPDGLYLLLLQSESDKHSYRFGKY